MNNSDPTPRISDLIDELIGRIKDGCGLSGLSVQHSKGRYALLLTPKEGTQRTITFGEVMDSNFDPVRTLFTAGSLEGVSSYLLEIAEGTVMIDNYLMKPSTDSNEGFHA